jgi:hypothetical protein
MSKAKRKTKKSARQRLRGLRGTVQEHASVARQALSTVEALPERASCGAALLAHELAAAAVAEAGWTGDTNLTARADRALDRTTAVVRRACGCGR